MRGDRRAVPDRLATIHSYDRSIKAAIDMVHSLGRDRCIAFLEWHESGASFAEIAAATGRSEARVKEWVSRGRVEREKS